jgi:hypothetical protein
MRTRVQSKLSPSREREERLRTARAAAQPLRVVSPTTASVSIQLRFVGGSDPLHATQSFVLYPAAKACFAYPCPYGDCDGIYDLVAEASRTLSGQKTRVTGVCECTGMRSRDGLQRQPCGLRMSYTISAKHESLESATPHLAR